MKNSLSRLAIILMTAATFGTSVQGAEWQHVNFPSNHSEGYAITVDYLPGEDETWMGDAQNTDAAWINVTINRNLCNDVTGTIEVSVFSDYHATQKNITLVQAEANSCRFTGEIPGGLLIKYFTGGRGGVVRHPKHHMLLKPMIPGERQAWIHDSRNGGDEIFFHFQL